jgi:hypothetical protein
MNGTSPYVISMKEYGKLLEPNIWCGLCAETVLPLFAFSVIRFAATRSFDLMQDAYSHPAGSASASAASSDH